MNRAAINNLAKNLKQVKGGLKGMSSFVDVAMKEAKKNATKEELEKIDALEVQANVQEKIDEISKEIENIK